MHQSFVSPPIVTLIQAININQLESIPFIKADLVQTHLPPSPATPEGQMERPKAGIRSIKEKEAGRKRHKNKAQDEPTIIPEQQPASEMHEVNNIFYYADLVDK